ncbi:MAG: hypothetical protein ACRDCZ_05735 [Culicoidibacterales bacterium]
MQIEYNTGRPGSNLGCWLWGILILALVLGGISVVFRFFFVTFPLFGFALIAYWLLASYRARKRRQAMMDDYTQQYEQYYQQDQQKQAPPTSVIDADYRVVDEQQENE